MQKEYLIENLNRIQMKPTERQIEQFMEYYKLLIQWNKVMNLTAITEYCDVVQKHYLDSLVIASKIDLSGSLNIIDMGTGAGFPGIPLKIMFPELKITLMDSLKKRIGFLNDVIRKLELNHICAVHGRAEDFAKKADYREQFDLCVSRAVANLSTLSEYCIPYVKIDGRFISYKSGKIQDELKDSLHAIKVLGAELEELKEYILPGTEIDRSFVIIRKKKKTDRLYPRTAGKPSKEPLKL